MTELDEVAEALIEPFLKWEDKHSGIRLYSLCSAFVSQQMDDSLTIKQEVSSRLFMKIKQMREMSKQETTNEHRTTTRRLRGVGKKTRTARIQRR